MLTDDTATLGNLGVIPESVILLKADEPIADYTAMDDIMQVCMPEEGFKGTGLLGHWSDRPAVDSWVDVVQ